MIPSGVLPGTSHDWHATAREWLEAIGCPAEGIEDVMASMPPFSPRTLKQVFTAVLGMGRRVGRLGDTMALLAHHEAALRRLRDEIGIPRAAPPAQLASAAMVVDTQDGLVVPGGWVPDLLDRAAGFSILNPSGASPLMTDLDTLRARRAQHLFIVLRQDGGADASSFDFPGVSLHPITDAGAWLTPGPGLTRAIFEAASRMHGVSSVFS